jgi:hypothetical protein
VRFETIPVVAGIVVGLFGFALLIDSVLPQEVRAQHNSRRRARSGLSPVGEGCIAVAIMCMAAALVGRDHWNYDTLCVIAGGFLFVIGTGLNWGYLRERISNRGALRRDTTPLKREPPPLIR